LKKYKPITQKDREIKAKWDKSKNAWPTRVYSSMRRTSRLRGFPYPSFTKKELADWANKNNFDYLWSIYEFSGKPRWLRPSVDRLDNSKGYSMDNIRLVTWKENHACRPNTGKRLHSAYERTLS